MTKGNQCKVPVKGRKPQHFVWSVLGSISLLHKTQGWKATGGCEGKLPCRHLFFHKMWILWHHYQQMHPLLMIRRGNLNHMYYGTLWYDRPAIHCANSMQSYSGPWEMCPRVLWGARVNGKIQDPLGWRRITSHRVSWGERHRCCIDPADKHWMAGSASKCQVPQTETPRQAGMKFGAVHGRLADKPAICEISRTNVR